MAGDESPLHAGEIALQQRAGVFTQMDKVARAVIRDHMPDQHREFFEELPTVLLGALGSTGHPVATMLAGAPGFMRSPDPRRLQIAVASIGDDPVLSALAPGAKVGVLGLQPQTRRRNRMNGTVVAMDGGTLEIAVDQSFGNCPKYIQGREPMPRPDAPGSAHRLARPGGAALAPTLAAFLARADTFFIASAALGGDGAVRARDPYGVDVSHRGGHPGFVRIDGDEHASMLVVPDFIGNFFFNTLGNLALNPACGLLFVDYEQGDLIHLQARADIVWEGAEVEAIPGAQRLLRLHVASSLWRPGILPLRWSAPAFSDHLPLVG